jgi:hypothetical protein
MVLDEVTRFKGKVIEFEDYYEDYDIEDADDTDC